MRRTRFTGLAAGVLAFATFHRTAHAQRPGGPEVPTAQSAVTAAGGDGMLLMERTRRQNVPRPHDWTVSLVTLRGQCYQVVASVARGSSRTVLEVRATGTRLGEPLPLRIATGSTRFCAELPGRAYTLAVHTDGMTEWALAVRGLGSAPATPTTTTAPAARAPDAGAPGDLSVAAFVVGGPEDDYVARQVRTFAQSRPGARPISAALRENLAANQSREVALALTGGHCVEIFGAAVPSVSDVDLELYDPAGNRVAQDAAHRVPESVRFCPPYSGTYRARLRVFGGFGATCFQAFEVR